MAIIPFLFSPYFLQVAVPSSRLNQLASLVTSWPFVNVIIFTNPPFLCHNHSFRIRTATTTTVAMAAAVVCTYFLLFLCSLLIAHHMCWLLIACIHCSLYVCTHCSLYVLIVYYMCSLLITCVHCSMYLFIVDCLCSLLIACAHFSSHVLIAHYMYSLFIVCMYSLLYVFIAHYPLYQHYNLVGSFGHCLSGSSRSVDAE